MSCSRCTSERSYQFEASPSVRVGAAPLPLVCRDCGLITIGGKEINLPEALEEKAMSMAQAAQAAGDETRVQLEAEDAKSVQIATYFERVYRRAYLDGFFRSLAFYQYNAKEGRMRRIRDLWKSFSAWRAAKNEGVLLRVEEQAYTEFDQLIKFSATPESQNAKNSSNPHQAIQEGSARLS